MHVTELSTVVANPSQDPVQDMTVKKVKILWEMFCDKLHVPDVAS